MNTKKLMDINRTNSFIIGMLAGGSIATLYHNKQSVIKFIDKHLDEELTTIGVSLSFIVVIGGGSMVGLALIFKLL